MNRITCTLLLVFLFSVPLLPVLPVRAQSGEKAIRATLQRYFTTLKSGQYQKLYDSLPTSFQKQTTREEIAGNLERLGQFLKVQRMEIGKIEQHGEFAVAETTIYGLLTKPLTLDGTQIRQGRVTAQQYLIREGGVWKIASTSERSLRSFLKERPEVASLFQQSHTRFELFNQGTWVRLPGSR